MQAFDVSENIGFDGSSYFCRRCGKAGYEKPTQVRGHLAMCPGTLLRKRAAPASGYNQLPTGNGAGLQESPLNQLQPLSGAVGGGLGGSQLLQPLVVANPVSNPLDANYEQLAREVATLKNEYVHMLQGRNLPQQVAQAPGESWIKQHLIWVVLGGGFMLMAVLSAFGQSCQCEPGSTRGSGPGLNLRTFSKFGERALNKGIDTAITKTLGKVLR